MSDSAERPAGTTESDGEERSGKASRRSRNAREAAEGRDVDVRALAPDASMMRSM